MGSEKRTQDSGAVKPDRSEKPPEDKPRAGKAEPVTTGDMQSVGATSPEEARKRRNVRPDEPPVEESPGDQVAG